MNSRSSIDPMPSMRRETNQERVEALMVALGSAVREPGRIYLAGGASAVLLGWRETTVDVDIKPDPEPAGMFQALPRLKDELDINIELAAPDDFIPPVPGWQDRSVFIARHGRVDFYHYDFYSQALSKLERDHPRDQRDFAEMLARGLVDKMRLRDHFGAIEANLIRYPAIDADAFRQRVMEATQ
jgi:hypothetical protein